MNASTVQILHIGTSTKTNTFKYALDQGIPMRLHLQLQLSLKCTEPI